MINEEERKRIEENYGEFVAIHKLLIEYQRKLAYWQKRTKEVEEAIKELKENGNG